MRVRISALQELRFQYSDSRVLSIDVLRRRDDRGCLDVEDRAWEREVQLARDLVCPLAEQIPRQLEVVQETLVRLAAAAVIRRAILGSEGRLCSNIVLCEEADEMLDGLLGLPRIVRLPA